MAKQRKEKEQSETEERSSRWWEKEENSLEIHLGSSWFVYFCYHLICNFCFRNIFMLYKFLIALDVEKLMGEVWWVWFLYQIIRHGKIPFRSVKINVATVYFNTFVFVLICKVLLASSYRQGSFLQPVI